MLYAALRQGLYIGLMGTWDVTIGHIQHRHYEQGKNNEGLPGLHAAMFSLDNCS